MDLLEYHLSGLGGNADSRGLFLRSGQAETAHWTA